MNILNDVKIHDLKNSDFLEQVAARFKTTIAEAKILLPKLTFLEYHTMREASVDRGNVNNINNQQNATQNIQPTTNPINSQNSNQEDDSGNDQLNLPIPSAQNNQQNTQLNNQQNMIDSNVDRNVIGGFATHESVELKRLQKLAGIQDVSEDFSGAGTCAGSIATVNAPVGNMQRRQKTKEEWKEENTHAGDPKLTLAGRGMRANDASKNLSANLSVNGYKVAGRKDNGRKYTPVAEQ